MNFGFPLQQFKLITGEEIICEVIEWGDGDNIIIRSAMTIDSNHFEGNERIYMFKPWFLYIESDSELIVVDSKKIVGNITPNDLLSMQYYSAVSDMEKIAADRLKEYNLREALKLKQLLNKMELLEKVEENKDKPNNIIKFVPPDTTFH